LRPVISEKEELMKVSKKAEGVFWVFWNYANMSIDVLRKYKKYKEADNLYHEMDKCNDEYIVAIGDLFLHDNSDKARQFIVKYEEYIDKIKVYLKSKGKL